VIQYKNVKELYKGDDTNLALNGARCYLVKRSSEIERREEKKERSKERREEKKDSHTQDCLSD